MTAQRHARRLLFLLPFPPRLDAAHGGSRVIAQFLMALCERHEVGLLYLRAADETPAQPELVAGCAFATAVERPMVVRSWRRRLRLALSLLRGKPMWASDWYVPAFASVAARLVADWEPDVINVEFHVMAQYLPALNAPAIPTVLTHHEPGVAAARGFLRAQHGMARLLYWSDLQAWRRFEKAILRQMDTVVVFTGEDRHMLRPYLNGTPVRCIPRGADLPARPCDPLGGDPPQLLFVGNFAHYPNVDAAFRLVKHIFPRIRAQRPDAHLVIVGPEPPAKLCQLQDERVRVTGRVAEVAPYLDRAAVVLAPLRLGGGMRVKIIEALAAGKAIVASPLATAGLPLQPTPQLLVADDDGAFAQQVLLLLDDPARREELARRARHWAQQHLDWQGVVSAYEEIYDHLLGIPGGNQACGEEEAPAYAAPQV